MTRGMQLDERSVESELMDVDCTDLAEFSECLRQLEIINGWTLAYRPTLSWLQQTIGTNDNRAYSILDVGAGGGDMLRRIADWNAGRFDLELCGVDINPWAKLSAEQHSAQSRICYETSDIFSFSPERRFDFVISSLFTHHLPHPALVEFLRWMELRAVRGWFINDLHRHMVPYHVIKHAVRLFRCNRLILHDAPVSVLRAFKADDWRRALAEAGIPAEAVSLRWFFPFRYCLARSKP